MKRRLLLVPLALGLLGLVAWLRQSERFPDLLRPAETPETAPEEAATAAAPAAPKHPPAAAPIRFGRLRVVIEGGDVPGRLLVFGARERVDVDRPIAAGAESLFEKIPAGPKNVVFLPDRDRLAVSAAAVVPPSGVGEARLALQPSATLAGTVVDLLQRPLPGVRVEVRRAPLFSPPPRPGKTADLYLRAETPGRGPDAVTRSTSLETDGSLRLAATSGADGAFALDGVEPGSLDVQVAWKDVRFSQLCTVGAENRIVVPGVPEAIVVDPAEADAMARITEWLRQIVRHPEAPEPYAAPLRAFLRERLAARPLTARERADLLARIESIGRR